ncbi:MAG: GTP-binding protein [archaeon]
MVAYDEQIAELEKRISSTKYNKSTQHAIGLYKAQIAKLREKQEARSSSGKGGEGYQVRKTGDGTVILLGFPSVGKSTLLNAITDAHSPVGAYEFTTLTVIPGVLDYSHAKIQILDVPGIVRGAASGRGRGKEVLACMRNADMAILLVDVRKPEQHEYLVKEAFDVGIRFNQKRPDVRIKKTGKNGIRVGTTVKLTKLDKQTITDMFKEFRINNADVVIREDISDDQLIDCIEDNKKYMPAIFVMNKADLLSPDNLKSLQRRYHPDLIVSAEQKEHMEELKRLIFERLNIIRIYMKEPGKPADMNIPLIAFKGWKVEDVCNKLHRDFVKKFKFCRIWGKSAKFDGQKLALHHVLKDEDVLELHLN